MPAPTPERRKLGDVAAAAGLRRMHVLAWRDLDDVEAGGSEVHAAEIASRWAAAGLDVVMRTSHAQGHLTEIQRDGYRVIRRRGRHLVFLDAPFQELVRRRGSSRRPARGVERSPVLRPAVGREAHAPPSSTTCTPTCGDRSCRPAWRASASCSSCGSRHRIYRRSTILTPSPSSRQQIIERLRLPADRVTAVPNGIDARFSPGGRRSPHPTVLSVGRLVPHKRLEWLIRAAHDIRSRVPDLELLVVGDGLRATAAGAPGPPAPGRCLRALRRSHLRRRPGGALPVGLAGRQRLVRRGMGHDDHRGGRLRHARRWPPGSRATST